MSKTIRKELRAHAPFTAFGAFSGVIVLLLTTGSDIPRSSSCVVFWILHPVHVLLSALVTTGVYRRHTKCGVWDTLVVGYLGSVGIAAVSDSCIPFMGEWLLNLSDRGLHLGFIEKWWLVNPLAISGIVTAFFWTKTRFPHAGHVLLSTWASLFHMTMALEGRVGLGEVGLVALFLFLSVWLPCCTSDIVFPLLFTGRTNRRESSLAEIASTKIRAGRL